MNTRTLGTIAMICAPALFIEGVLSLGNPNPSNVTIGVASFVFMAGWICSNLGMQQMQATGSGIGGKLVLHIRLVGLVMAMLFGLFEALNIFAKDHPIFIATDLAWPLSMVFMIVVGIATIRANRWSGWQRFVPLLSAGWLPVALLIGMGAESNPTLETVSVIAGFAWTAICWVLLALVVRSNATLATPEAVLNAS